MSNICIKSKEKHPQLGPGTWALARACPGPGPWGCFSFDFIYLTLKCSMEIYGNIWKYIIYYIYLFIYLIYNL